MSVWGRKTARRFVSQLVLLALAACGGSGGSGTDGSPAAPQTSRAAVPLALSAGNASKVAGVAVGAGERVLQFGHLAADAVQRFAATTAPISEACINGTRVLTLTDRDANGRMSVGDRILVQWKNCGETVVGEVLTGTMTIDITAATDSPTVRRAGSLDLGDGVRSMNMAGAAVVFKGSVTFDRSRSGLAVVLTVLSTSADDFMVSSEAAGTTLTESLREVAASKVLQYDEARAKSSIALRYESQTLQGSFTVRSPRPLLAHLNTYPDDGLLEVRGAGNAVLQLRTQPTASESRTDIFLDTDGDGTAEWSRNMPWADMGMGYLWWDERRGVSWSSEPYQTLRLAPDGFSYSVERSPSVTNDGLLIQFSRTPSSRPALAFRYRDLGGTVEPATELADIDAAVDGAGALIQIRPLRPLHHARSYAVDLSVDGGLTWSGPGSAAVRDALGNEIVFSTGTLTSFITPDTLRAVVTGGGGLLQGPGDSVRLDASGSNGVERAITGYRWRQVSGTPLALSDPTSPVTEVRWSATAPTGVDTAVIELSVSDSAGESETRLLAVYSVASAPAGHVVYLRSTPGDYIGSGQVLLWTEVTGTFLADSLNDGYVGYSYRKNGTTGYWYLDFASANELPFRVGAYDDATRAAFHGSRNGLEVGRGCIQVFGRFDVLEIETDGAGNILRLAIDFEQHCDSPGAPGLYGSLRTRSSIPLRP